MPEINLTVGKACDIVKKFRNDLKSLAKPYTNGKKTFVNFIFILSKINIIHLTARNDVILQLPLIIQEANERDAAIEEIVGKL